MNLFVDDFFEEITKIVLKFDAKSDNYLNSYPYFLNYFSALEIIKLENVIIGISFTYSWMPTVLKKIIIKDEDEVVRILNAAKLGYDLSIKELAFLKSAFNNSLVGSSKLLHFINPDKFAIWDSKVFRCLYSEAPHKYKLEKPEAYLGYLETLNNIIDSKQFNSFHELMNKQIGYKVSKLRAIELAFFSIKTNHDSE